MNLLAVDAPLSDEKAHRGDGNHQRADHDQREAGDVAEPLPRRQKRAADERRRRDLQEQVEFLHDEAEGHHRDRGADPGEEGAFIGGVIAEILDHRLPDRQRIRPRLYAVSSSDMKPAKRKAPAAVAARPFRP
jgi:hypothetical protein